MAGLNKQYTAIVARRARLSVTCLQGAGLPSTEFGASMALFFEALSENMRRILGRESNPWAIVRGNPLQTTAQWRDEPPGTLPASDCEPKWLMSLFMTQVKDSSFRCL